MYCTTSSVEKSISYETEGRVRYGFSHATSRAIRTHLSLPQRNIPFIIYLRSMKSEKTIKYTDSIHCLLGIPRWKYSAHCLTSQSCIYTACRYGILICRGVFAHVNLHVFPPENVQAYNKYGILRCGSDKRVCIARQVAWKNRYLTRPKVE